MNSEGRQRLAGELKPSHLQELAAYELLLLHEPNEKPCSFKQEGADSFVSLAVPSLSPSSWAVWFTTGEEDARQRNRKERGVRAWGTRGWPLPSEAKAETWSCPLSQIASSTTQHLAGG